MCLFLSFPLCLILFQFTVGYKTPHRNTIFLDCDFLYWWIIHLDFYMTDNTFAFLHDVQHIKRHRVSCGSMYLSLRLAIKHGCKQEPRGLRLPFVVTKKFPRRLILLLLDSVCIFNDALKIGRVCSQLPLSPSLNPFHHLGFLAGGCGNSFDYVKFLAALPCVRVRAAALRACGFSLTFSSYHLSHVANWQVGERPSIGRILHCQVLFNVSRFPDRIVCNCPQGN